MSPRSALEALRGVPRRVIGRSVEGRPIESYRFGCGGWGRLILAGIHGDEPKSVYVARRLCADVAQGRSPGERATVVVVPVVNPDGYELRKRRNTQGVDVNRNFPTRDWSAGRKRSRFYGGPAPASEPETQAILALVESLGPAEIIALHSISEHRQCNNFDGPGESLARAMSECNSYPVTGTIGYSTLGSLGTWAGLERNIATVTVELPSHDSPRRCWEANRSALLLGV
jgi:protein MpaA